MLAIILSVMALFALLFIIEFLGRKKVVGPELKRKSFHVISGSFIAFWPWLMSWRVIELLALGMLIGVVANYQLGAFNFRKGLGRKTYGDAFLAVAIVAAAYFAGSKIFFALAILNVSLADGLAALIGKRYGKNWRYQVFGQAKTVIGTMTFWLVSLIVAAVALLFAKHQISFNDYVWMIILLPPIMAALENFSFLGIDNLTVPLTAIAILSVFT